jgi:uncharacterized protein (DUF4415 family)
MKGEPMKKAISDLTAAQRAELEALATLTEEQINTRDIPEQTDWRGAQRGLFYRPVKQQLTLRLDADVIAWFKDRAPNGEGYQTRINSALREYVAQHAAKRRVGRQYSNPAGARVTPSPARPTRRSPG